MVEIGSQSYRVLRKATHSAGSTGSTAIPNPLRAEHKVNADFETNKLTTCVS